MALPFIGGLLGGIASAFGAGEQRHWEAAQAQKQMDFQRDMSSTIYQRGTADLRAAGLNPILAAGNVATPGGSGAMASGGESPITAGISGASTALGLQTQAAALRKLDAEAWTADAEKILKQHDVASELATADPNAPGLDPGQRDSIQYQRKLAALALARASASSASASAVSSLASAKQSAVEAGKTLAETPGAAWASKHPVLARLLPGTGATAVGAGGVLAGKKFFPQNPPRRR